MNAPKAHALRAVAVLALLATALAVVLTIGPGQPRRGSAQTRLRRHTGQHDRRLLTARPRSSAWVPVTVSSHSKIGSTRSCECRNEEHYLTDIRTAVAGAFAARMLAPSNVKTAAVHGADSLLTGHTPAHAGCPALGKRAMSLPLSARMTCAVCSLTPGTLANSST